ncbi:MAG: sigma factor-like helix-turn-helix DNA-binding protein [Kofleriaceae bacterium]
MTLTIEDQLTAARARWPDLVVEPARFAAELVRRLGAPLTPELLGAIRADDVYLAIACSDGAPAAVAHVEAACAREVEIAAKKLRGTPDQADELHGHLRQLLFTAEPGRAAALATITGRGDLRGYLRVIASRELIRMINRGRKELPLDDEVMLDGLGISTDPEISVMRRRYGSEVDAALRAALASLDERSRALLRYAMVDGWSSEKIGAVYGVHRGSVARWLQTIRADLGDKIRAELATRLKLPADEVTSVVRMVQSRIEISFARLLGAEG